MLQHVDQHLAEALPLSYGGNDTSILVGIYCGSFSLIFCSQHNLAGI